MPGPVFVMEKKHFRFLVPWAIRELNALLVRKVMNFTACCIKPNVVWDRF